MTANLRILRPIYTDFRENASNRPEGKNQIKLLIAMKADIIQIYKS